MFPCVVLVCLASVKAVPSVIPPQNLKSTPRQRSPTYRRRSSLSPHFSANGTAMENSPAEKRFQQACHSNQSSTERSYSLSTTTNRPSPITRGPSGAGTSRLIKFVSTIQDLTGSTRRFRSPGWADRTLTWTGGIPEASDQKFIFEGLESSKFRVSYSYKKNDVRTAVDSSVCTRVDATANQPDDNAISRQSAGGLQSTAIIVCPLKISVARGRAYTLRWRGFLSPTTFVSTSN